MKFFCFWIGKKYYFVIILEEGVINIIDFKECNIFFICNLIK